ncbi:SURF1 family protein [Actinotalea sp. K2]|uniref:SURF1 family cytochrome oxidase biogenesis protein n=1 Tax=Actinotalea sp. K2 TaxID=2939438 RepID=UPI002016AFF8|nr:SURF1 family protein [Actinotalea sp. K2]MCL3861950.1 SURF1 family protein [Actinotalea sp. K2]
MSGASTAVRAGRRARLRRWVVLVGVASVVAAGCVAAGVWQWTRHVDRSTLIEIVQANYDADPVPLAEVLDAPAVPLPPEQNWQVVRVQGEYSPATVLLRNRPVAGQPSFHVLSPFTVTGPAAGPLEGTVLVVDRGWVPTGADGSDADTVPAPPTGPVELVVRLRPDEPASRRDAPAGQVQAISAQQVRAAVPEEVRWPVGSTLGTYGMLVTEDGSPPSGLGPLARPSTDPGSHLSYAFQWWVFALGALAGSVVLGVREDRAERAGTAGPTTSTGPADPPARRRRPTAEEEEDALLDAQSVTPDPRQTARVISPS